MLHVRLHLVIGLWNVKQHAEPRLVYLWRLYSRAVIVRTAAPIKRKDGSTIRFDDNACVLVDKKGQPVGNRVLGVVAQEVRNKGWGKITALAPKVV